MVEGLNPVLLNFRFGGDAQLLLHLNLHRQPVGIPTGLAVDLISLHGLVPADTVLQSARQYMVDPRFAISRGGTFVKDEPGSTLALRHTALLHVLPGPIGKDFFFPAAHGLFGIHLLKFTHG